MKWWLEDGVLYFQHYEKTISSKRLIPYRSAHTSTRLSWDDYFVSMLRGYMVIPATPGSVLLHRIWAAADKEKNPKLQ